MTGILAQIIAITSFGNEYLKKGVLNNFYPENSTFQHCDTIDFREMRKKNVFVSKKEFIIAYNPLKWFEYLKKNDCVKLRLYYQTEKSDDRKLPQIGWTCWWWRKLVYRMCL